MMRRTDIRRGVRTFGLLIAAAVLCAAQTVAQEKSSNRPVEPQRETTITRDMLAPQTYAEILKRRGLTQKDSDMQAVFPKTATGAALARVATLVPYGLRQDDVPEARQMALDLALVRAAPEMALTDLQSGFRNLPEKYWAERQFLIQVAAHLTVPAAAVVGFLTAEMSRTAKISTGNPGNLAYLSPVTAADTLLRVVSDSAERDRAFRQAVRAQPDRSAGRLVLSRYELVDAARARNLATELDLSRK
jgi:hypothetical protein